MHAAQLRTNATRGATLLVSALLVLALLPIGKASAAANAAEEYSFRDLMNVERVNAGRNPLKMKSGLSAVARQHSQEMASSGSLFHNPDLTSDLGSVVWSVAGENVGFGATVESLHQAFMNSAPHRKNIMRKTFKRVGVGVVIADSTIWVTVVFAG